jgi:hypothetical protein
MMAVLLRKADKSMDFWCGVVNSIVDEGPPRICNYLELSWRTTTVEIASATKEESFRWSEEVDQDQEDRSLFDEGREDKTSNLLGGVLLRLTTLIG